MTHTNRPDEARDIPGFEGLIAVTRDGRIWSHRVGRWMRPRELYGYLRFSFSVRGSKASLSVHRAVALAWIANPEGKEQVNHLNGVKTDNRVENLEWATRAENQRHAWATGLSKATPAHRAAARAAAQKLHAQSRAKTHCLRGHPLSGENLYVNKAGQRSCKECKRAGQRKPSAKSDQLDNSESAAMGGPARAAEPWEAFHGQTVGSFEVQPLRDRILAKAARVGEAEHARRLIAAAPELRAALEPFANIDGEGDEDYPDDTKVTVHFGRSTNYTLTLGDFRRARDAATKAEGC